MRCAAINLSLPLSLSLSLSNALPRYHGYSYFKLEVFILTEPFLSRRSSLFVICFQFSFNLCIKIPYLRYIRVSYIFFFFFFSYKRVNIRSPAEIQLRDTRVGKRIIGWRTANIFFHTKENRRLYFLYCLLSI